MLETHTDIHNKSYSQKDDTNSILLDRIQWANNYPGRLNLVPRMIFYAIACVTACSCILLNEMPDSITFIGAVLCVWLFLMSFNGFFSHHGDKFCAYAIENNVEKLRRRLGYKKGDFSTLTKQTDKFSPDHHCPNFVYSNIL